MKRCNGSLLALMLAGMLAGCTEKEQGPAERLGERVDDTVSEARDRLDEAGDELEEAADEVGEALRNN